MFYCFLSRNYVIPEMCRATKIDFYVFVMKDQVIFFSKSRTSKFNYGSDRIVY